MHTTLPAALRHDRGRCDSRQNDEAGYNAYQCMRGDAPYGLTNRVRTTCTLQAGSKLPPRIGCQRVIQQKGDAKKGRREQGPL